MKGNKKGYTFIEIMVAIVVLTLGFSTTVALMKWTIRGTLAGSKTTRAITLAQDKLEYLMRSSYSAISSGSDSTNSFTRTWTVTTSDPNKTIAVTVTWSDLGNSKQVSLSGIRTE